MIDGTVFTIDFTTNGVQFQWFYPYYVFQGSDLVVVWTDASTNVPKTLVFNSDYTVSGIADTFGCYPNGVTVSTATPPNALTAGTLHITRDTERTQRSTWIDNSPFPANQEEHGFDKLTLMIQEISQGFQGFLPGPPSNGTPSINDWFIVYPAVAGTFFGYIYTTTGWKPFAPISF